LESLISRTDGEYSTIELRFVKICTLKVIVIQRSKLLKRLNSQFACFCWKIKF